MATSEILNEILLNGSSRLKGEDLEIKGGTLLASEKEYTSPNEAVAEFQRFEGPGWLMDARAREIAILEDGSGPLPGIDAQTWPELGERVSPDRKTSLHLRYAKSAWVLTTLTQVEGGPEEFISEEAFMRQDLRAFVIHQTAWKVQQIGPQNSTHSELRPALSRFLGFRPLPKP